MRQLKLVKLVITFIVGAMFLLVAGPAFSSEMGQQVIKNDLVGAKQECMLKCQMAKAAILKDGLDAVVEQINAKDKTYVSDDTYVFVLKLDGTMIGHPYKSSLVGKNMIETKDKAGKYFFEEFIKVASETGSGWVDYVWPKPNQKEASQKTSYILKVNDDVLVGAGFYK